MEEEHNDEFLESEEVVFEIAYLKLKLSQILWRRNFDKNDESNVMKKLHVKLARYVLLYILFSLKLSYLKHVKFYLDVDFLNLIHIISLHFQNRREHLLLSICWSLCFYQFSFYLLVLHYFFSLQKMVVLVSPVIVFFCCRFC